jgi:hypothetical protein
VTELLVGAAFAAVALVFVLLPLLNGEGVLHAAGSRRERAVDVQHQAGAIQALREIEFDRATGKLSDRDYDDLKSTYTAQAIRELRASDAAADVAEDPAEALVRAARSRAVGCGSCGEVPPEVDATYCSTCGHYLRGWCGQCGDAITGAGARFCASCGWRVAA